jgi:hypothetical protein
MSLPDTQRLYLYTAQVPMPFLSEEPSWFTSDCITQNEFARRLPSSACTTSGSRRSCGCQDTVKPVTTIPFIPCKTKGLGQQKELQVPYRGSVGQ